MKKEIEDENVSIDIETGEEIELEEDEVMNSSLKLKLKKLRDELTKTKKERDENLAGWQRAKADLVNLRKNNEREKEINAIRSKAKIIKSILPAIDAFETAMKDVSWKDVDEGWRSGVERIASQLTNALKLEGVEMFGEVDDEFNPEIHECMSVTETKEKEKDHEISEVFQKGYRFGKELIRPAKVMILQFRDKKE
jgi:molecular chaperone GrpE